MNSIIGHTGFVGANLITQMNFDNFYNSTNIQNVKSIEHKNLYLAAPSATKWKINQDPAEDRRNIELIIENLDQTFCERIVMFSTVDVYTEFPVTEEHTPDKDKATHYGRNRIELENFVASKFENHSIIRLPGLFGPNLKKNIIFDIMNQNIIKEVNLNDRFQWFDITLLSEVVQFIAERKLNIFNLSIEPMSNRELLEVFYNVSPSLVDRLSVPTVDNQKITNYDMKTKHFHNGYYMAKGEVKRRIGEFISI